MVKEQAGPASLHMVTQRIKTFSLIEKIFYGSIVVTSLLLAIGIIFMQTRILQLNAQMTSINQDIYVKKIEINDARQAANELMRESRLLKIAEENQLTFNNDNIGVAE